jgi:uncharacterized protein (TIGR03663 family)
MIPEIGAPKTHTMSALSRSPRVTVEVASWVLVAAVALALRLVSLGTAPLDAREAREAMLAWRAALGQGMPSGNYSPLLFSANAFLFSLCGATDALARLWPALFGSSLVLAPCLFRRRSGRVGALVAASYLAISPMAVFASRQLSGAALVAVGGAVLLGGTVRFFDTGRRKWLALSAVGVALAVTAAPSAWDMLVALGLAVGIFTWVWSAAWMEWLWKSVRPHLACVLVVFVVAVLVFSTGMGWNLPGVGATGDLLAVWASRLGQGASLSALGLLALYEPLAFLSGLGGMIWAIRRKRRLGLILGLWGGLGIVLHSLMPGQPPAESVWLVFPLAMLGGSAIEMLVQRSRGTVEWRGTWPYAAATFALWVYLYLRIVQYALRGDFSELLRGALAFAVPLLLLLLVAILILLTAGSESREVLNEILAGTRKVLRGAAAGTCVMLLLVTFAAGWGCAHVRPAALQEPLVAEPTAVEVRSLVQTLQDISWRETGTATALSFVYDTPPDSVLAWYLRHFNAAHRVEGLREADVTPDMTVVVNERRDWLQGQANQGDSLVGQDFALQRTWDAREVRCIPRDPSRCQNSTNLLQEIWCTLEQPPQCQALAAWLLLRQAPQMPKADTWAVLWMSSSNNK